jgi:hypothetical protein
MKARKILVKVLVVLLVVVTAALIVRAVLNFTTGKALDRYLAAAKARGVPLSFREMTPTCLDSDNGAKLWKAVEAVFDLELSDRDLTAKTIDDYFYGKYPDEKARAHLTALAEKHRLALDLIIEAGGRPCFQYGDWTKPSHNVEVPKAVKLVQAVRLLAIDAALRADKGQIEEALEECRGGLRFVQRTLDEPSLFRVLVAMANTKALLISFNHIVRGKDIAPASLASWKTFLDPGVFRSEFVKCLQGERALVLEDGFGLMQGKVELFEPSDTQSAGRRFLYWLIRPALKSETLWVQKLFDHYEDIGRLSHFRVGELSPDTLTARNPRRWYFRTIVELFPNLDAAFMKEGTLEAMVLTTRAGLACKAYRKQFGRYPDSLAALVPGLLDSEPIDPFTGKPLVYKVRNDGVLIYSLGANQKDDGGRGTYKITQMVMDKDDDWAWEETPAIPNKR